MKLRSSSLIAVIMSIVIFNSCQPTDSQQKEDESKPNGKMVFVKNCRLCHGADGQLGLNGAANLAESKLTKSEIVEVVTHGRKNMQPFESLLSKSEIDSVSNYLLTLRNQP